MGNSSHSTLFTDDGDNFLGKCKLSFHQSGSHKGNAKTDGGLVQQAIHRDIRMEPEPAGIQPNNKQIQPPESGPVWLLQAQKS